MARNLLEFMNKSPGNLNDRIRGRDGCLSDSVAKPGYLPCTRDPGGFAIIDAFDVENFSVKVTVNCW